MNSPDLTKLHDFYQPSPPSWLPQTVAWYVLFGVLGLALLCWVACAVATWMHNRYRRDALRELRSAPASQFSAIVKRTALVGWPRSRVAALTGKAWTEFLAESSSIPEFRSAPGTDIESQSLRGQPLKATEEQQLRRLAERWIRSHHD